MLNALKKLLVFGLDSILASLDDKVSQLERHAADKLTESGKHTASALDSYSLAEASAAESVRAMRVVVNVRQLLA